MKPDYIGSTLDTELISPMTNESVFCDVEVEYYQKAYPSTFDEPEQQEEFVFLATGYDEDSWNISLDEDLFSEYESLVRDFKRQREQYDVQ